MNVLSLFDGMSCGMIALERAGIEVGVYYASEIDKYAQIVSEANYPQIVRMGDVTKWREWDIDWSSIDLLIGGSPCQGFSFAGKQLAFDDPRSALFFEYVNILNHIKSVNPKIKFFLENVKMKNEYLDVISGLLGVEPVFINSSLVSAQNRQRYYWANWEFGQPEDKGIMLADILELDPDNTTFMSDKFKERNAHILRDDLSGKAKSLSAMEYVKNGRQGDYINSAAMVGRKLDENGNRNDSLNTKPVQCLEVHEHGKARCLSTVAKDTLVSSLPKGRYPIISAKDKNPEISGDYLHFDPTGKGHRSQCNRVNLPDSKHKSLSGTSGGNKHGVVVDFVEPAYRKLTPIECERLQTVPDDFTAHVSNTQRYRMLGNGWTIDVIAHIFKSMILEDLK